MCNQKITINENSLGFVFEDKHFLCEGCHGSHSEEELNSWMHTIMQDPSGGMPIALWLIHEQNKGKTIMSMSTKK
jgi:hypothetical protein